MFKVISIASIIVTLFVSQIIHGDISIHAWSSGEDCNNYINSSCSTNTTIGASYTCGNGNCCTQCTPSNEATCWNWCCATGGRECGVCDLNCPSGKTCNGSGQCVDNAPTPTSAPGCSGCSDNGSCGSTCSSSACGWDSCGNACRWGQTDCSTQPCTIQGFKREEPGGNTGAPFGSQTITADGTYTQTLNPYSFNGVIGNTSPGLTTSIPSGYVAGYSTCQNRTNCHTINDIQPYTSSVPATCPAGGYNDFWWHYCQANTAPTNIQPSGNVPFGSGSVTLSWGPPTQGSVWMYAVRVDDLSNPWNGSCTSPNPGDICLDQSGTSINVPVVSGRTYGYWVHVRNQCKAFGPTASGSFTVINNSPPVPVLTGVNPACNTCGISWSATGIYDEVHIERCTGSGCTSGFTEVIVSATSPVTDTGLAGGVTYGYRARTRNNSTGQYSGYSSPIEYTTTSCTGSCTATLTRTGTNPINISDTRTYTANINISGPSSLNSVNFSSSIPGIASVSPTTDNLSPHQTVATGVSAGTTNIRVIATLSNNATCNASSSLQVLSGPTITPPVVTPTPTPSATPTPTVTPTPTPPLCNTAAPRDPPTVDCATSSITWRWCEVAGANSYEADILTTGDVIEVDETPPFETTPPPFIDNNWWLPAPPDITCGIVDASCATGRACEYTTGPNMPDGAYQSATRARNTGNSCRPSNWSTSGVMTLACNTIHFAGGGADIIAASGPLRSLLPPFGPPPYFIDDTSLNNGTGIAIGRGVTLDANQVNTREWLVDHPFSWSTLAAKPENQYQYLTERIVAQATPVNITSGTIASQGAWDTLVNSATSANKITLAGGSGDVVLLRRTGDLTLSVNIDADTTLAGSGRKVILIVDGNLTINGTLTVSDGDFSLPGSGLLVVFAQNNITVANSVGEATSGPNTGSDIRLENYPPHLEGIFYAGGTFDTGGGTNKLRIDGTVIGYSGVTLGRQYAGKDPGTYFMFRPDLTSSLYQVGLRRKIFQELVNP